MKNKEDIQFVDKVIGALRKTAIELEESRVQAALGKAEAQDKYEEIKKKFNLFIHDSRYKRLKRNLIYLYMIVGIK